VVHILGGRSGVGIAIGVQVGEEDILDVTTTEAQT